MYSNGMTVSKFILAVLLHLSQFEAYMYIIKASFENYDIRRVYDEQSETWYFSVVDIIRALAQQPDFQTARKYWNKLKKRLKKVGSNW